MKLFERKRILVGLICVLAVEVLYCDANAGPPLPQLPDLVVESNTRNILGIREFCLHGVTYLFTYSGYNLGPKGISMIAEVNRQGKPRLCGENPGVTLPPKSLSSARNGILPRK